MYIFSHLTLIFINFYQWFHAMHDYNKLTINTIMYAYGHLTILVDPGHFQSQWSLVWYGWKGNYACYFSKLLPSFQFIFLMCLTKCSLQAHSVLYL